MKNLILFIGGFVFSISTYAAPPACSPEEVAEKVQALQLFHLCRGSGGLASCGGLGARIAAAAVATSVGSQRTAFGANLLRDIDAQRETLARDYYRHFMQADVPLSERQTFKMKDIFDNIRRREAEVRRLLDAHPSMVDEIKLVQAQRLLVAEKEYYLGLKIPDNAQAPRATFIYDEAERRAVNITGKSWGDLPEGLRRQVHKMAHGDARYQNLDLPRASARGIKVQGQILRFAGYAGLIGQFVLEPTTLGCSDASSRYFAADPSNNCRLAGRGQEFSQATLAFLNSSPQEVLEVLKRDKRVCEAYQELANRYLSDKPKSLVCSSPTDFSVSVQSGARELSYKVKTEGGRVTSIQSVGVSPSQNSTYFLNSTEDISSFQLAGNTASGTVSLNSLTPQHPSYQRIQNLAQDFAQMKLYMKDAQACCASKSDAETRTCMARFNPGGSSASPRAPMVPADSSGTTR